LRGGNVHVLIAAVFAGEDDERDSAWRPFLIFAVGAEVTGANFHYYCGGTRAAAEKMDLVASNSDEFFRVGEQGGEVLRRGAIFACIMQVSCGNKGWLTGHDPVSRLAERA